MPDCYIIAGPNGAGKTTFAREFLPRDLQCFSFVNPDLIAAGLSPFDPARAMIRAGRLVVEEISSLIDRGQSFSFETTLSGRSHIHTIEALHNAGYLVHVFYLWISSVELGLSRIRLRVEGGGHNVPEPDARRRYRRSLQNLLGVYRPLVDTLQVYDNSTDTPQLVFSDQGGETKVSDVPLHNLITRGPEQ